MTNREFEAAEVRAFKSELLRLDSGSLAEKIECVNKMMAEIKEDKQKFRYNLFLLLHGDHGTGARLVADKFTSPSKLTNFVELFVLVAQVSYLTGASLAYTTWKDRLTLAEREEMLNLIKKECDRYNQAYLDGTNYEWERE